MPRLLPTAAIALIGMSALARPAAAQDPETQCTRGTIREIVHAGEDVFPEAGTFLLRAANAVHIQTRASYIMSELLVEEGDCYDPFLVAESARLLRSRYIINTADIETVPLEDGDVRLVVRTRDNWSLAVSLGLSVDEGLRFEGLGISERNFLGLGSTLGFTRLLDREYQELGALFGAPRVLGSPVSFDFKGGETRTGDYIDQRIQRGFLTEVDRFAFRQQWVDRSEYFAYSTGEASGVTHLLLPHRNRRMDITLLARAGSPGRLWTFGGGVSRHELDFTQGLEDLVRVSGDDFDDLSEASAADRAALTGQTTALSATRLNAVLGFRRVDFIQRARMDGVGAIQDVKLGSEATLVVGRSVGLFADDDDADDVHLRLDLFGGIETDWLVLNADGFVAARRGLGDDPAAGRWRDVQAEVDVRAFIQPGDRHTVLTRITAAGAWAMDRPWQLTGGGRYAIRGYSRDSFPGSRRLITSIEDRTVLFRNDIADLGLALFGDLGRVWAGDVPWGQDTGWKSSIGAGLRISAPGGRLRTTRLDLTLPTSGQRHTQGVFFRLYVELGGLFSTEQRPGQVDRSRWSGIDSDLSLKPAN